MKFFKKINNKRGQVTFYIVSFIVMVVIVVIAGVLAPLGVRINTEFVKAGEQLLLDSNESISSIEDDNVRSQIQSSIGSAVSASQTNIDVQADLFQYSWVLMLAITAIIIFLATRQIIEFGGSSGGFV